MSLTLKVGFLPRHTMEHAARQTFIMEEVGVFLWFCTDNSCVSVCPSVPRVSLAHLLLRLNKRNDLDIKYTQSKCQTKESRGTGTRPGQDFTALVSYSCLPEAVFLFGGRQSASTSSFKWKYLQMINKYSTTELRSRPTQVDRSCSGGGEDVLERMSVK